MSCTARETLNRFGKGNDARLSAWVAIAPSIGKALFHTPCTIVQVGDETAAVSDCAIAV
jgi:hypothetical protein